MTCGRSPRDLGADYHKSRLEAVASRKHFVRTASGARLGYDALIVATGARAVVGVPGAITFRDQRDIRLIRRLLGELEAGAVRRIVFALPTGAVWPLPLYELALLSARHARERGLAIESTVVTPEREPLALFGTEASAVVRGLLEERGVRFVGGAVASRVQRDGSVALADGELIPADRVVALPELRGRRFTGVPASRSGFVPVDASGRVEGLEDVYAAGDLTTFPIKQGGLAAQQADVVAQTIAAGLGVPVKQVRAPRVLQARLLGGDRRCSFVRNSIGAGNPRAPRWFAPTTRTPRRRQRCLVVTCCPTWRRSSRCRTTAKRRRERRRRIRADATCTTMRTHCYKPASLRSLGEAEARPRDSS